MSHHPFSIALDVVAGGVTLAIWGADLFNVLQPALAVGVSAATLVFVSLGIVERARNIWGKKKTPNG